MNNMKLDFLERLFKSRFVKPTPLVLALCVLGALCGKTPAQEFKQVHPGVEHAQVNYKIGEDPVKINLLRLDLTRVRLNVRLGMDQIVGTETTSSIAARHGAVAAINAGFFRLDNSEFAGDPAGVLMINGRLLSESTNNRISIGIRNDSDKSHVEFDHLTTESFIGVGVDTVFKPSGINRERRVGELILYKFGVGKMPPPGIESTTITFGLTCRTPREDSVSNEYCRGKVLSGETTDIEPMNSEQFTIVVDKNPGRGFTSFLNYAMNPQKQEFRFGNIFKLGDSQKHSFFNQAEDITNGVPQLIKGGKIEITWEQEKASRAFVFNRHPRTAVAKLKDGKFLMVTVDGRQLGVSVGMTLQELAEYLLSIGATDAMNLDGGGSTTMVLDGKVVNKPSDPTGERKIGDAIVVTLRKTARP